LVQTRYLPYKRGDSPLARTIFGLLFSLRVALLLTGKTVSGCGLFGFKPGSPNFGPLAFPGGPWSFSHPSGFLGGHSREACLRLRAFRGGFWMARDLYPVFWGQFAASGGFYALGAISRLVFERRPLCRTPRGVSKRIFLLCNTRGVFLSSLFPDPPLSL